MLDKVVVQGVSLNDITDHPLKQTAQFVARFTGVAVIWVLWVQLPQGLLDQECLIDVELPYTNI
jgi:hypothetical protein